MVTSNLAVRNPLTNELVFLKLRPCHEDAPLDKYIEYGERHDMFYHYQELIGKYVILDWKLLNYNRSMSVFQQLAKEAV